MNDEMDEKFTDSAECVSLTCDGVEYFTTASDSRRVWTVQSMARPVLQVSPPLHKKCRRIVIRFLKSYPRNWHLCPCRNTEKKGQHEMKEAY